MVLSKRQTISSETAVSGEDKDSWGVRISDTQMMKKLLLIEKPRRHVTQIIYICN